MGTNSPSGRGDTADSAVLQTKNGIGVILVNPKERERFLKFMFVGVMGAVVDFGVLNLLVHLTPLHAEVAQAISFSCAVFSNFMWNRYWTYPDSRAKKIGFQVIQFAIINIIGLGVRTPLFAFLNFQIRLLAQRYLPTGFLLSPVMVANNVALAISVLVVMLWNFGANRFWTYNDVSA